MKVIVEKDYTYAVSDFEARRLRKSDEPIELPWKIALELEGKGVVKRVGGGYFYQERYQG